MTPAEDVLAEAKHAYNLATEAWAVQFDLGGIVKLDRSVPEESDEIAKGCKYKTTSPVAATVMGVWQKRKAELDHAALIVQRERARLAGPAVPPQLPPPAPDTRLPPERDDDAEAPL